jgi:hypothetical protein
MTRHRREDLYDTIAGRFCDLAVSITEAILAAFNPLLIFGSVIFLIGS